MKEDMSKEERHDLRLKILSGTPEEAMDAFTKLMFKYQCVRCGDGTDKYLLTEVGEGPLCQDCFELYKNNPAEYLQGFRRDRT